MKSMFKRWGRFVLVSLGFWLSAALPQAARAQTWATNTPLQVARWSHTATLLNDNTVLVAGGLVVNAVIDGNFTSADTNAVEIYDPAADTTTPVEPMNTSRHQHRATLLPSGRVLVSGGGGDASSEEYEPAGHSWTNFASMNDERLAHAAVLLPGGQVLAAGGFDDDSGQELSSAELYDPTNETWSLIASMPYRSDTLAAVLLTNGTVLVCGGSDAADGIYYQTNAVIYYPASQTWSNTAPMNEARTGHTATLLPSGKVMVEGGTGDNSAEIYDPVARTWTPVAGMNDGRLSSDAALLQNGQVLVCGDGNSDVELYDPVGNTWTLTDSLPVPGNFQAITLLSGGQVVITGGSVSEFNGPPLNVVETYGTPVIVPPPQTGTWSTTGSMPYARVGFTLTVLTNGKVLAPGGQANGLPPLPQYAADLYDPATGIWTNNSFMNTPRDNYASVLLNNGLLLVTGGLTTQFASGITTSCELYYPATGTWTNTGSMNEARDGHVAVRLNNGKVLVAGGTSDGTAELYNPTTQTWAYTGSMNEARTFAPAFLLPNGKVLIVDGADDGTAEVYDPSLGTWSYTSGAMLATQEQPATALLPNGEVLVAGGYNDNVGDFSGFSELYNAASDSWSQTGTMNTPREGAATSVLSTGIVLVAGGSSDDGSLADAELYDPQSGLWTETGAMKEARETFPMVPLPNGQALVAGGFGANATGNGVSATAELYATTAPLVLSNAMILPGGSFRFSFQFTPGSTNTVFASTNAGTPFINWLSLGTATEVSNGMFQFTDTTTHLSQRYYRVVSP